MLKPAQFIQETVLFIFILFYFPVRGLVKSVVRVRANRSPR